MEPLTSAMGRKGDSPVRGRLPLALGIEGVGSVAPRCFPVGEGPHRYSVAAAPQTVTTFDLHRVCLSRIALTRFSVPLVPNTRLLERDGRRHAYRLTDKGVQAALLFLFSHKRPCGPLANSRFHHQSDPGHQPDSKLEAAYHKADKAIQQVVDLRCSVNPLSVVIGMRSS